MLWIAIALFTRNLQRSALFTTIVTLASFGARAMRNATTDVSVGDVRQQLVRSLVALITDETVDQLSRSLAWCTRRTFHGSRSVSSEHRAR